MSRELSRLWSPWRETYVVSQRPKGCIFCTKPKSRNDAKQLILRRARRTFSMLNLYPYNNGHLLIAPYRHVGDIEKLTGAEASELMIEAQAAVKVLKKILRPDGFNIGFNVGKLAGASYGKHLHLHVVPRWKSDTNFMPVICHTRVISQSLRKLYTRWKAYGHR